jgi:hypothetical protein
MYIECCCFVLKKGLIGYPRPRPSLSRPSSSKKEEEEEEEQLRD